MDVKYNGYGNENIRFEYLAIPRINTLDTYQGTVDGGTIVSIFGNNFISDDTRCLINYEIIIPNFVSNTNITCVTPIYDTSNETMTRYDFKSVNFGLTSKSILTNSMIDEDAVNSLS